MLPHLYGISVYFTFWIIAAVAAILVALAMTTEAGLSRRASLATLILLAVVIIIGSKLYFLAGYFFFPSIEAQLAEQQDIVTILREGYRIPGGILLMAVALPPLCRFFRLPVLRFADAMMPSIGIAVIFVRLGCFMNGCCYGMSTRGPLGVRFPVGSKAYETQLLLREIAWPADHTLAVHPLQLYYAAAGLMLYVLGRRWQATKQFDGEVWAKCYAFYFGTTFLLEFFRSHFVYINLIVPPVIAVVALLLASRARQTRATAIQTGP
jgi:phosphatidylglycerol:prolipoprotein diacylglycerol transferase